jgi:hypothetical protein
MPGIDLPISTGQRLDVRFTYPPGDPHHAARPLRPAVGKVPADEPVDLARDGAYIRARIRSPIWQYVWTSSSPRSHRSLSGS